MKLILASASPRRADILRETGIPFEIFATHIPEHQVHGESAEQMVARLARAKAVAAVEELTARELIGQSPSGQSSAIIVGADTCVELDGEIFGKPCDADHATDMLARLSGRTHYVLTGVCAIRVPDRTMRSVVESAAVTFKRLDPDEIEEYVDSGEPIDKAGGYAIQGRAARFITRVAGTYFNVMGLPIARLFMLLKELGWNGSEASISRGASS